MIQKQRCYFFIVSQHFACLEGFERRQYIFGRLSCDLKSRVFLWLLFTVVCRVVWFDIDLYNGFSTYITDACYLQWLRRLTVFCIAIYMQSTAHINFDLFFVVIWAHDFSQPSVRRSGQCEHYLGYVSHDLQIHRLGTEPSRQAVCDPSRTILYVLDTQNRHYGC